MINTETMNDTSTMSDMEIMAQEIKLRTIEIENAQTLTVDKGIKILQYLYVIGVKFNLRKGLKAIASYFTNGAVSREDTQKFNVFFESTVFTKHRSGEYPIPENLEEYEYLKYAVFNKDFTAFKPIKDHGYTLSRDPLYKKAEEVYQEKHYYGSAEYHADQQAIVDALIYEVDYLTMYVDLPEGCYFKGHGKNHVTMYYDSPEAYDELHYGAEFNKHGTQFTTDINGSYELMPELRKGPFEYSYHKCY